jgi:hypothetical protein
MDRRSMADGHIIPANRPCQGAHLALVKGFQLDLATGAVQAAQLTTRDEPLFLPQKYLGLPGPLFSETNVRIQAYSMASHRRAGPG